MFKVGDRVRIMSEPEWIDSPRIGVVTSIDSYFRDEFRLWVTTLSGLSINGDEPQYETLFHEAWLRPIN